MWARSGTCWGRLVVAAIVVTGTCGGCQWKGDPPVTPAPSPAGDYWQIRPVRMRIYPSSRFVQYKERSILEARVELFDEAGDSTKGVGTLRFELFASDRIGEVVDSKQLFAWDIDMMTLDANRQFYDPVTRAYLFRLGIDELPTDRDRVVLRVTFSPVTGNRLVAHAVMRTR